MFTNTWKALGWLSPLSVENILAADVDTSIGFIKNCKKNCKFLFKAVLQPVTWHEKGPYMSFRLIQAFKKLHQQAANARKVGLIGCKNRPNAQQQRTIEHLKCDFDY